jgi:hypothetical protein
LSSKEAEILLAKQPLGTFLVRLSKSAAGNFAIAFAYDTQKIIHILVTSMLPEGYAVMDQETNSQKIFKDLFGVIESYSGALKKAFVSSIPLQS